MRTTLLFLFNRLQNCVQIMYLCIKYNSNMCSLQSYDEPNTFHTAIMPVWLGDLLERERENTSEGVTEK